MSCPNCGNTIQGGGRICPWCGVLINNLGAGVVASPGKRFSGFFLDVLIGALLWIITTTMIVRGLESDSGGQVLLGYLLLLAYIVYYFILLSRGQSYGKWILGMRAFRISGEPAGFGLMLLRETIGKLISGLVFALGYLWLLWDQDRQTWHDKFAGTVVMIPDRYWE